MASLEYLLYSLISLPTFGLVFCKLVHCSAVRRIIIFLKKWFPCLKAIKSSHSSYKIMSKELFLLPFIQSVGSLWWFCIYVVSASLLIAATHLWRALVDSHMDFSTPTSLISLVSPWLTFSNSKVTLKFSQSRAVIFFLGQKHLTCLTCLYNPLKA